MWITTTLEDKKTLQIENFCIINTRRKRKTISDFKKYITDGDMTQVENVSENIDNFLYA